MKKRKPIKPKLNRPIHSGGTQKIYTFPNGYGASVVRHSFSYGGNRGLWELAVIKVEKDDPTSFTICYDTPITSDVIGHLSDEGVEDVLHQIKALKSERSWISRTYRAIINFICGRTSV